MKFVILSSGRGTVMKAVLQSIEAGDCSAQCQGLVTDTPDRGCVKVAEEFGIPIEIVMMKQSESREAYDKRLDSAIQNLAGTDDVIIACMGWLWMLSPWFVQRHRNRILNVHPSLLPKHPGAHAHDQVLAAGDTESGMTIHMIDEGMDTGKILLQKSCPVEPNDTVTTLRKRVQALECMWYPKVLQMIERGEIQEVKSEK